MTPEKKPTFKELREAEDKAAEAYRAATWTRKGLWSRKRRGKAAQKRIDAAAAALTHATQQRIQAGGKTQ
jgi:hypothetical protein